MIMSIVDKCQFYNIQFLLCVQPLYGAVNKGERKVNFEHDEKHLVLSHDKIRC